MKGNGHTAATESFFLIIHLHLNNFSQYQNDRALVAVGGGDSAAKMSI